MNKDKERYVVGRCLCAKRLVANAKRVAEIQELASQLALKDLKISENLFWMKVLGQPNFFVVTCHYGSTGKIVAMACIGFLQTFTGLIGYIEDVIVREDHRGKGLGERMMRELICLAREKGATYIKLTIHPTNVAANKLYEKVGFQRLDTSAYWLNLQ